MKSLRRYKFLIAPVNWIIGIITLQFFFWLIAFPEMPSVIDGEPRETSSTALASLFAIFSALGAGLYLGSHAQVRQTRITQISRRSAVRLAVFLQLVSTTAALIQLFPILSEPGRIFLILEPAGINRQAEELREAQFGIPTLVTLWIPSLALYVSAFKIRYTKGVAKLTALLLLTVIFYGAMMMSRTHIITALLMIFGAVILYRPDLITLRRFLIASAMLFLVIWSNAVIRTGVLVSYQTGDALFSVEVQIALFQEFVEKYLGGEFNNSVIIATYDADPSRNFLYGSMFADLADTYRPNRYLNTMNILGYIYWQFGLILGSALAGLFGFLIGRIGRLAWHASHIGPNYFSILYIVSFPGFLQISRINYFFLPYFITPFLILSIIFFIYKAARKPQHRSSARARSLRARQFSA